MGFVGHCSSFLDWLDHIFTRCNKDECNIVVMLCWRIWINRNDRVWNNKASSAYQVLNSAGQLLYQWQVAKKKLYYVNDDVPRQVYGALYWDKPKFGWVKCNVDAVVFASQGKIGFGCVF